jgi:hypothetical protein
LLFAPVPAGHLSQRRVVERPCVNGRYPTGGHCDQRARPAARLQEGSFSKKGSGSILGQSIAVALDPDYAVEHEDSFVSRLTLADQDLPRLVPLDVRPSTSVHQLLAEHALECRLD